MTSFFPALNVWVALSDQSHIHSGRAWEWLHLLPREARLIFSRYTHIGLLRLLASEAGMGPATLTLEKAWHAYDTWLSDPRVEFYPEPSGLEAAFHSATAPFAAKAASKWVGDSYLLAFSKESQTTLVTFDRQLFAYARKTATRLSYPPEFTATSWRNRP